MTDRQQKLHGSKTFVLLRSAVAALFGLMSLTAACGGSSNPSGPSNPGAGGSGTSNGTITAIVDGVAWDGSSISRATYGPANPPVPAILQINGVSSTSSVNTRTITINSFASGPGTYSLDYPIIGPLANMVLATNNWTTALPGGTGSITVTSMTADRVVGTFEMLVQPSFLNSAPLNVPARITNGQFNLRLERF